MVSAWKEPFGRDDRANGQGAEPEANQLELFEILSRASAGTVPPSATSGDGDIGSCTVEMEQGEVDPTIASGEGSNGTGPSDVVPSDVVPSDTGPSDVEPGDLEIIASSAAARDFLEVGGSDSDDLRRLEESIRWLTNAGTMTLPLPRTATLPSVVGRSPVSVEDDALLLDPDTLFPQRRRSSSIAAGAAKIMLVSAIAAPTAYFVASWSQFSDETASSEPAVFSTVATPVALSAEQTVALGLVSSAPVPQVARRVDEISTTPQPEPTTSRAVDVTPAPAVGPKTASEQPSTSAAAPVDAASPPRSVAMPLKPSLRPEEIAMLVERGRFLFESGDVAAARLFFRRAANAGNPAAATALGTTYDPEILSQRFIRGIEPDAIEAQKWYEKARDMETRVEMLAHR
jgi:hypothetical protein